MIRYKKIIKITSILLIVINIITLTPVKADENFSGVTEAALRENIVPLKTVEAGNGFEDMKPLEEILKDKKIVSMGEATHGTKEFFQMKHRMFEFLVEKMGYRLFAIEGSFGECQIINDYVLYGKGSANEALKRLEYWTWNTEEVTTMIEWMREYNKNPNHKSKVKFYGFDMQSTEYDKKVILNYLNRVDKDLIKTVNNLFTGLSEFDNSEYFKTKYRNNTFLNERKSLNNIIAIFDKNKDKYISESSLNEYQLIHQDLINVYQNCYCDKRSRDQAMCDNVKWILDYEKQFGNDKIMLWAHNAHVDTSGIMMGGELRNIYGDEMYAIGFEFYDGSFLGVSVNGGLRKMSCLKPDKGTFPDVLNRANVGIYFMDLKKASTNKYINEWLSTWQPWHEFDARPYDEDVLNVENSYIKPINSYDGIIFVKNTNPSIENYTNAPTENY